MECCFCISLYSGGPGMRVLRRSPAAASNLAAVTVLNGMAVCDLHIPCAQASTNFIAALSLAQAQIPRDS